MPCQFLLFAVWIGILALALALSSGFISLWCYLGLQERPKKPELRPLLEQSSQTLLTELERKFRGLETEWDDMYQKFSKLAGRMDRYRGLSQKPSPDDNPEPIPAQPMTRAELLRRYRSK